MCVSSYPCEVKLVLAVFSYIPIIHQQKKRFRKNAMKSKLHV